MGRSSQLGIPLSPAFPLEERLRLDSCQTQIGTVNLIHTYLRPTVLDQEAPRLHDAPRSLNLVTIKREIDLPNDFRRSRRYGLAMCSNSDRNTVRTTSQLRT